MRPIVVEPTEVAPPADPGPAPMLQWVELDKLVIDEAYQRDLGPTNWKAIRRIARDFCWGKFSPLFLTPVPGGKFAIIDGQHRAHAAALCGIEAIPAQVVQMSREEAAAAFSAVNGSTTKVHGVQLYKAALAAGEAWAVEADAVCRDAGVTLLRSVPSGKDRKPREIMCHGVIAAFLRDGKRAELSAVLGGMAGAAQVGDDVTFWSADIIRALVAAVQGRPAAVVSARFLAAFLDRADLPKLLADVARQIDKNRANGVTGSRSVLIAQRIGAALDRVIESARGVAA